MLILAVVQCNLAAVQFRVLHSFPTNSYPQCTLVFGDDHALYGTTQMGGDYGYGSIFRVSTNGNFTNLFSFARTNGAFPYSGLLKANDGCFYGTAQNYGPYDYGTVFRVTTNGALTTLFSFSAGNGAYPKGRLIQGKDGRIYGTTFRGGSLDYGTVFQITTNGGLTTLASLTGTNGAYPLGGLIEAQDGAFYGTAWRGGIFDGSLGYGTLYRVTTAGEFTPFYFFQGYGYAYPLGELLQTPDGLLYGAAGGFYRATTNGDFASLGYNVLDPLSARSGLMRGLDGALYGMDYFSIVRITTNSVVMHLWPFYNYWNGQDPRAGVVQDGYHTFYGTTAQGGWPGGGIVFRLDLDTVFYPLTRATNGWNVMFLGLAGDTYRVLRAASAGGPWNSAAEVTTDDYGLGRWVDTSGQEKAFYLLSYP